ncbi:hypothetical protein EV195_101158 [Tenacibaculum skagerrakense]|uniref:Uncharacterized protein n=1 Tax=Tenacibaculum skagerrakense TaxID=186571 RepID=A0A4R2P058_9FLAO|nr:hypothetical protein [Tenacibaculum skagerrakense]TCP27999.1 hypothetical protein EV195_101158 [Tenacibaculum skagerrakense]
MLNSDLDDLLKKSGDSDIDANEIDLNINLTQQEISDRIQDREERKKYAYRTFIFLSSFTGFIILIIIGAGFSEAINFKLDNTVLISLITSSLASIVGIFILVMRYLFR